MKFKSVLLIGSPGTGKTSVGHILDKIDGYKHYSNGEELRNLISQNILNPEIARCMNDGLPIPAELMIPEVIKILNRYIIEGLYNPEKDILLLDGLPRDEKQLVELEKYFDIKKVFIFYVNDGKIIFRRIAANRGEKRIDDLNSDIIKRRIDVIKRELNPIISHFQKNQIVRINSESNTISQMVNLIKKNI